MPKFTDAFIGRVRDSADIVSIIERHVTLKKSGTSYLGLCPFHQENSPSFNVVPSKKLFKCFGCNVGGDVFKFISLLKNIGFGDSIKMLAEELHIPIEYQQDFKPPVAKKAPQPVADEPPVSDEEADALAAMTTQEESVTTDTGDGAGQAIAAAAAPVAKPEIKPEAEEVDKEEPADTESTPSSLSLEVLREFYKDIPLTQADVSLHWQKRGLRKSTLETYGIKSAIRENVDIIQRLFTAYGVGPMVDSGLYVRRHGEGSKPSPKFYGWGIGTKKAKEERKTKDDKFNYGWTFPPMIPYLGDDRLLYFLRPHKDQIAGMTNRFYVPQPLPDVKISISGTADFAKDFSALSTADYDPECHQAVITEGELKALALLQIVGDESLGDAKWAVAALPGITNAKPMLPDIVDWLDRINARSVVVVYDNEEKGDPKLPGYVKNEWERYDAEGWARYLALQLVKEGFDAKVGHIPNEWRDDKGKADWDGSLVKLLRQYLGLGFDQPLPPEESIPREIWRKVRHAFIEVLKDAAPAGSLRQFGLFDKAAEGHIHTLVNRISKTPQLPIGGRNEESIANRIYRFIRKYGKDTKRLPYDRRAALNGLAKKYKELDGRYYTLKELSDTTAVKWEKEMDRAVKDEDVEYKRLIEIAKRGIPDWISDFYIKPLYCLKRVNGERERMIVIKSIHKPREGAPVMLPSNMAAQPSKFREWLMNNDNASGWKAGERNLQDLQMDMNKDVAFRDVSEVVTLGLHEETGIYFYVDVAILKDGTEILPDPTTGIFWHDGDGFRQGYKLSKVGNAKQPFRMGFPRMHPHIKDPDLVKMFGDVVEKFHLAVGWQGDDIGYDGYVCLGVVLACFAGQEIYNHYVGMPGLWIHGESQQGKNCITRWLLPIHGYFRQKSGIVLPGSTEAGLGHALEQYGDLMVWLDEFQPEMERTKPWLVEKIKNAFDRSSGTKMVFGDELRQIRAAVIVNGIATAREPQVKNRYAHVQISAKYRKGAPEDYDWFEKNSPDFYLLGRHILRRRAEFAKIVMEQMADWKSSPDAIGVDDRAQTVYGAAYAGMYAAAKIFNLEQMDVKMRCYRKWLYKKARESVVEIKRTINVNQFWTDLISAIESGAFGYGDDLKKVFKAKRKPASDAPIPDTQLKEEFAGYQFDGYYLFLTPNTVIDTLRKFKIQGHRDLPLELNDLYRQMQTKPWFVSPERGKERIRERFKSKNPQEAWCIDVCKHELGYTPCTDKELRDSMRRRDADGQYSDAQAMLLPGEWSDPRQGDLFTLIHKLMRKEESR